MMVHIHFFDLHPRKERLAQLEPRLHVVGLIAELLFDERFDLGGEVHVVEADFEAVDAVAAFEELLRGGNVDVADEVVELEEAGLENAGQHKAADGGGGEAGTHARRAEDHDGVAEADAEAVGEEAAEDHAGQAVGVEFEAAADHVSGQFADLGEGGGVDTAHHHAFALVLHAEHRLFENVGRSAGNVGNAADDLRGFGPVGQALLAIAAEAQMGVGAEDAFADFAFEAVHDGEHDDQRGDTERDAADRKITDERDEPVMGARAQIAQRDVDVGLQCGVVTFLRWAGVCGRARPRWR